MSQRKLNLQLINNSPGFCDMCWRCWFQYHLGISWTPNQWHIPPFYSGIVLWHVLYAITLQGTRVFFFQRGILKVLQTKSQQSSDMHCALWPNVDESVWRIQRYMHTCYIHVVYTILCVCLYIKRAFWRCKTVQEDCRMLGQSVKLVQKQKYTEHWTDITWIGTQVTSPILWWFNTALLEKCVRKEQKQKSRDANGIIIYKMW